MNQIERNIVNSFNLAKHDIHMLKGQVQHLADMQEKIIDTLKQMQKEQERKPKTKTVTKVVKQKTPRKNTHYIASKTANKFHNENCPFAQNIKPKSKIRFLSKVKALNEGFKPCKCVK